MKADGLQGATDPDFVINAMFAGADNPGGGSVLTKNVTGDALFSLSVINGVEAPGSQQLGLSATTLNVNEAFSVDAGANLLRVSNTFTQTQVTVPEPGTLALLGSRSADWLCSVDAATKKQACSRQKPVSRRLFSFA